MLPSWARCSLNTLRVLARSHDCRVRRLGLIPRSVIGAPTPSARGPLIRVLVSCRLRAPIGNGSPTSLPPTPVPSARVCAGTKQSVVARSARKAHSEGPLNATSLGGANNGGSWWDCVRTKIAVELRSTPAQVIFARRLGGADLRLAGTRASRQSANATRGRRMPHPPTVVAARALGVVTRRTALTTSD